MVDYASNPELRFFLLWLGLMFPLIFSPGPANLYIASITSRHGFSSAISMITGISLINIIATFLVGLLFQELLSSNHVYFEILKILGLAYLVYLSIGFIRDGKMQKNSGSIHAGFRRGLLLQALNGKLYPLLSMMFTVMLQPSFANTHAVLKLTFGFTTLCLASYLSWALLGSVLYQQLSEATTRSIQRYLFGTMFCFVTLYLIVDTLKELTT